MTPKQTNVSATVFPLGNNEVEARKGIDTTYLTSFLLSSVSKSNNEVEARKGKPEGSVKRGFLSGYIGLISVPGGSIDGKRG